MDTMHTTCWERLMAEGEGAAEDEMVI